MPETSRFLTRRLARSSLAVLLASGMVVGSGCGSLSQLTRRDTLKEKIDQDPRYSIAGVQGPTERSISQANWERKREDLIRSGDEETTQALAKIDAAQVLFDAGKFAEAESAFQTVVKERRNIYESFGAKFRKAWVSKSKDPMDMYANYGDTIEEDALFMVAESQYAQRHFPDAEVTYQDLLERYPSTRYLDPTMRQMFRIARYWLGFPEDVSEQGEAEVRVASHENELGDIEKPTKEPSPTSRVPVLPNVTDNSRPLFDTYGRGKLALRAIWLHDATGPLADDALMMSANHSLRTEDYVEAARLYALLREQYPDSPHLKDAYLLGSHVTLASYQGPAYDSKSLESSRELKQEMLALFPDLTADQREQLRIEVDRLQDAEVARMYDLVEFYTVKRMYPAVKLHCYQIINEYPDSKYAEMARERLRETAEREVAWNNSIWNFNRSSQPAPVAQAKPTEPPAKVELPSPNVDLETQPLPEPAAKPSFLQRLNPLRRAEQPPKLERIKESPSQPEQKSSQTPGRASL